MRWGVGGMRHGVGGNKDQEGGDICTHIPALLHCTAKTNTTL